MGYTHQWYVAERLPQASWDEFTKDVAKVVERGHKILVCGQGEIGVDSEISSQRPPIVNAARVQFNGKGGGCETFSMSRVKSAYTRPGRKKDNYMYFSFCKTEHQPYDKYVAEVLCLAEKHFGDEIRIETDHWEKTKEECAADV